MSFSHLRLQFTNFISSRDQGIPAGVKSLHILALHWGWFVTFSKMNSPRISCHWGHCDCLSTLCWQQDLNCQSGGGWYCSTGMMWLFKAAGLFWGGGGGCDSLGFLCFLLPSLCLLLFEVSCYFTPWNHPPVGSQGHSKNTILWLMYLNSWM